MRNKEQKKEPTMRLVETDENGVVTEKVLKRFCIVYSDDSDGMHLERRFGKGANNGDVLLMYHALKKAIRLFEEDIPELAEMEKFFERINYLHSENVPTDKGNDDSGKDSGGSVFED